MALLNVEEATKRFGEKLESGYFSSMREEAHRLAKQFEPDENYSHYKEERDTNTVCTVATSGAFKDLIKKL